jgi:hypothetical protein
MLAEQLPISPVTGLDTNTNDMKAADHHRLFVTGGAVSQRVYAREWESDLDVWVPSVETGRLLTSQVDVEVVVRSGDTERCIERFDMSVVQQGYFVGQTNTGTTAFCTPLALYSWQSRVLVALPSRECIEYTGFQADDREQEPRVFEVDIWHYIVRHEGDYMLCGRHHDGTYHDCALCGDPIISSRGHQPFQRWRARMRTYVERFPEFKVVYCHSPGEPVPRGVLC